MVNWKTEWIKLAALAAAFAVVFYLPAGWGRFDNAVTEALLLARSYAREHVLTCLIPAFFIAGAIAVFISQASVMKYLGAKANKVLAYGVASVSGSILAVCSCTVLPLFGGIWRMGAGLGPACAFLYSGPAINVLAIVLTARVLGLGLGIARAVGAVAFSVLIGLVMHLIYRKEEQTKADAQMHLPESPVARPLWQNAVFFALLVGVLVFANWGQPSQSTGIWAGIYAARWLITAACGAMLGVVLVVWFGLGWWRVLAVAGPVVLLAVLVPTQPVLAFAAAAVGLAVITSTQTGQGGEWFTATWGFAKQITPLLLAGVLVAGFLLGRPGHEGLILGKYVEMLVGNSPERFLEMTGWGGGAFEDVARVVWPVWTCLFASVIAALMYFATLTEVPILQGLMGAGMGKGPALALLLAGPALSLPNMLVIASVLGVRKTVVYVSLVVAAATAAGLMYGAWF